MDKAILILSLFAVASGLDLEAELQSQSPFCSPLIPATNVNVSWVRHTEIWYIPHMTRSELIRTTKLFLKDAEFIQMSEERAAADLCFLMNFERGEMFGFGKKLGGTNILHNNPIRPGIFDWKSDGQYGASTYILLTDNLSYIVGVDVFPDGTRGGYVMTSEPDMTKFSNKQVLEWKQKLVDGGFNEGSLLSLPTKCAEDFWKSQKVQTDGNVTPTVGTTTHSDNSDAPKTISSIK